MYTHAIMLMSLQRQRVGKDLYIDPVRVYLLILVYICMRTYLSQVLRTDSGHPRVSEVYFRTSMRRHSPDVL